MYCFFAAPPKSLNKEELVGCVEFVFSGLEDRNVDIRKVSAEAIFPFMLHLGFDCMSKLTSKVKVFNFISNYLFFFIE